MVKKSKPKSTGKKKSTAKKKAGPKKPAVTSGAVKKGAAKSKVKARPKKGKISTKNLLLKKFDTSATAVYKPKATALKIPDSPPFVTGLSAKETKRVKALLLKAFDLKAAPAKKKAAPAKKATAKPKTKAKPKAKKPAEPKKAKVSVKDLLLKKFDTGATAVYKPKATASKIPDSPPFVTGLSADETKRVKALLLKAFDLKAAPAKKKAAPAKKATAKPKPKAKPKAKKPAEPKKAKVSVKDLLLKKFDTSAAAAKDLYTPEAATSEIPDSPPFVTGYDADETKRIRALLLKRFDLKAEPAIEETPEPGAKEIERPTAPMPLPSVSGEGSGSVAKAMVLGLCGLAVLIAFVIGASFSNRDKFYLKEAHGAVQVWQGKFAPVGTEMVMSLDGMKLPTPVQDVYSEEEAYGMVYNHFLGKADALMNQPGWPDFRKVNAYLHQAAVHAPSAESRAKVQTRINGLNFLVLLHRSDVALARGTMADLEAAQEHLKKADAYASIGYQQELVERRRVAVERALAALATK